jgi:hypothetical protein
MVLTSRSMLGHRNMEMDIGLQRSLQHPVEGPWRNRFGPYTECIHNPGHTETQVLSPKISNVREDPRIRPLG